MQELTPLNRQSFYGKAKMIEDKNKILLKSYNTIVAEYNTKTEKMTVNGWYSRTTARHINAFLAHFGYPTATKKQMDDQTFWD